ncbi:MAG: hypothetical protein ABFS46_17940 [Myxococcota bacterium]
MLPRWVWALAILLVMLVAVRIEASVRFDPERDQVDTLELIENGQVVSYPEAWNQG